MQARLRRGPKLKADKSALLLYAVTDRMWTRDKPLVRQVEESIEAGVTFVQLREKNLPFEELVVLGKEIKKVTDRRHIPFVINDDVEAVLACDADGVHMGQHDMEAGDVRRRIGPDKILGVSVQTVDQAILAERHGADYLGVGAVFSTSTKKDADEVSFDTLQAICGAVSIPVIAIGGISRQNILRLKGSGICGIAVVSAIFAQPNITAATKELHRLAAEMLASVKTVLTIAGSDCSGGAGIQADIKTITAHKIYASSVITALTAQNTTGVYGIMEVTPEFVARQIDCVFTDIRPDAVKIGMVSNADIIHVIAEKLKEYKAQNIVVDPVMVSTSNSKLLCDDAVQAMMKELLPLADVITPNIPEAQVLSGRPIHTREDMQKAAKIISADVGTAVLIKGGHLTESSDDLLYAHGTAYWFDSQRVNNKNTHGTGCTLSSAIACNLALGYSMEQSIENAKKYITGALLAGLNLGSGSGPLNHYYNIK